MSALDPNTGRLPPTLRALAIGVVAETAVATLNNSRPVGASAADHGARGADHGTAAWQDLRRKCDELMALVLNADHPEDAAAYVLGYLPKHFEYVFELLCGRQRGRVQ